MLHIKHTSDKIKLLAGSDYSHHIVGTPVATVKDTGNGLIFKFPSHSSINQDNYICIDYSEAHYMWLLLIELQDKLGFCEEEIGSVYGGIKMRVNQFEYRNINGCFPEIVRWKSDLEDSPEYCYTLLLWKLDREGYSIEFIGNRPFNEYDNGELWALMTYAQAVLDAEFKLKETLE